MSEREGYTRGSEGSSTGNYQPELEADSVACGKATVLFTVGGGGWGGAVSHC